MGFDRDKGKIAFINACVLADNTDRSDRARS
jgi:hypothetical protein